MNSFSKFLSVKMYSFYFFILVSVLLKSLNAQDVITGKAVIVMQVPKLILEKEIKEVILYTYTQVNKIIKTC